MTTYIWTSQKITEPTFVPNFNRKSMTPLTRPKTIEEAPQTALLGFNISIYTYECFNKASLSKGRHNFKQRKI
jgi:hypothetical protein